MRGEIVLYTLSIVRADTTAEQEGCVAIIISKYAPVELLSATTHAGAFGIEEEVVDKPLVVLVGGDVVATAYADGLDD